MGQSIGIVSLGRRSLDKQTYGAILKGRYPNLVLVPSGGRGEVQSFGTLVHRILEQTVWGVEFFMLCDRDALPPPIDPLALEESARGRLKLLKRYHLENYFLEEQIIALMFSSWEPSTSWLVSADQITARLKEIARGYISYAAVLIVAAYFRERVGNLDIMPRDCHGKTRDQLTELLVKAAESEQHRISEPLSPDEIRRYTNETVSKLENSLLGDTQDWKVHFPGRIILKTFCSSKHANFDFGRFTAFSTESESRE
jgi:hypothetical protein